jgi:hypothetical protein
MECQHTVYSITNVVKITFTKNIHGSSVIKTQRDIAKLSELSFYPHFNYHGKNNKTTNAKEALRFMHHQVTENKILCAIAGRRTLSNFPQICET